jgi:hypothetical protein
MRKYGAQEFVGQRVDHLWSLHSEEKTVFSRRRARRPQKAGTPASSAPIADRVSSVFVFTFFVEEKKRVDFGFGAIGAWMLPFCCQCRAWLGCF